MSAESDEEFYDCSAAEEGGVHAVKASTNGAIRSGTTAADGLHMVLPSDSGDNGSTCSMWSGRACLPALMFHRSSFSVWSFLKQCIGKELSKITMPVIFNEPLSFLQRVVEYMEYFPLVSQASASNDPVERLELITAFAVSATASNWLRIGKPFNPLLGETFELDRPDLGIRVVCEQVSHHPPVSAFHVESAEFTFSGAVNPKIKFWGKSVEVTPRGIVTLVLKRHNESYSWQNVNCCVHNIIVGKIWIEHYGAIEVLCNETKWKSVVNFRQCGWFGRDMHKVDGFLFDNNKRKLKAFYGKWIEALYSIDVDTWEEYLKAVTSGSADSMKQLNTASTSKDRTSASEYNTPTMTPVRGQLSKTQSEPSMASTAEADFSVEDVPTKGSTCDLSLPGQRLLWRAVPKPSNADQYYSFTSFALTLNELNDTLKGKIAPTDSRLRPDIRKMEEGDMDAAAEEKNRVEEIQRSVRKDRKKIKDDASPLWFRLGTNPYTGKEDWLCNGEYWQRDWSRCPRIY